MGLAFQKYEGLGNDFVVVDAASELEVSPARATALCDRRHGVGADGVLLVLPARDGGDARMRVVNADGSVPEMCGNGARCVALHLARARGVRAASVRIETDAGLRACTVDGGDGEAMVAVEMGPIGVLGERSLDVDGTKVTFTVADAGNPHAVLFDARARSPEEVQTLGPRLAAHPSFANGTNVEFARMTADGIDLVVWERGVGLTLACGTGACATAAVACAKGLAPRGAPIAVRLPGGRLDVTLDESGHATMRGPARHVFSGVY